MLFGFAIAALSKTLEKGIALVNIFMVGSTLLSGVYFSNGGFPAPIKFVADLLPATMAIDIIRGIYSYGESLFNFPMQLLGILTWALVVSGISVKFFRWYEE